MMSPRLLTSHSMTLLMKVQHTSSTKISKRIGKLLKVQLKMSVISLWRDQNSFSNSNKRIKNLSTLRLNGAETTV